MASALRCPTCGQLSQERYRPFCSKRCADIDLHGWLSEKFRLPAAEDESVDVEGEPEAGDSPRRGD